jgi:hypothetical protein
MWIEDFLRVSALAGHLADAARVYRSTGDKATLQATFSLQIDKIFARCK